MKKLAKILTAASLLATVGCSSSTSASSTASSTDSDTVYHVAIVKQLQHASLDEIADAIMAELDVLAQENGVTIVYDDPYDGENDQSKLTTIATEIVNDSDGTDVIIPIATLAAQTMAANAMDTEIPVVFAAISDPESAELNDLDNVTGTSDALNTTQILDMMLAENPDITKVGLLYSTSEDNSKKPIEEAKAYLDDANIAYVEATGNTTDDIQIAVTSLISQGVEAIFTPTDNVVMSAELSIAESLAEAKIPHYTGADSFVRNGAFATCGVNYTELGTKTADLAYQVMVNGFDSLDTYALDGGTKVDNYYVMNGSIITVNEETATTGGFDYSVFDQFGEVTLVQTTED